MTFRLFVVALASFGRASWSASRRRLTSSVYPVVLNSTVVVEDNRKIDRPYQQIEVV